MIFILIFLRLERQGALIRKYVRAYIAHACALAQTAPLLTPRDKAMASFRRAALYLGVFDWKVQRFCWPKGTSLECVELIYVKTTCVSEELYMSIEEEEIVSLCDSRIERICGGLVILSVLKVRVVDLEYKAL